MAWNKVRQQLEEFLTPKLKGTVEYTRTGYRYHVSKNTNCYLVLDKVQIFNQSLTGSPIKWYESEQEAKGDDQVRFNISEEDINRVRQSSGGKIPEDRLRIIAQKNKNNQYAKTVIKAQTDLPKIDFQKTVNTFLTTSIEQSLESDDIMLNVLAIIDRRVGKKRLEKMSHIMELKHPSVRYIYKLRLYGKDSKKWR